MHPAQPGATDSGPMDPAGSDKAPADESGDGAWQQQHRRAARPGKRVVKVVIKARVPEYVDKAKYVATVKELPVAVYKFTAKDGKFVREHALNAKLVEELNHVMQQKPLPDLLLMSADRANFNDTMVYYAKGLTARVPSAVELVDGNRVLATALLLTKDEAESLDFKHNPLDLDLNSTADKMLLHFPSVAQRDAAAELVQNQEGVGALVDVRPGKLRDPRMRDQRAWASRAAVEYLRRENVRFELVKSPGEGMFFRGHVTLPEQFLPLMLRPSDIEHVRLAVVDQLLSWGVCDVSVKVSRDNRVCKSFMVVCESVPPSYIQQITLQGSMQIKIINKYGNECLPYWDMADVHVLKYMKRRGPRNAQSGQNERVASAKQRKDGPAPVVPPGSNEVWDQQRVRREQQQRQQQQQQQQPQPGTPAQSQHMTRMQQMLTQLQAGREETRKRLDDAEKSAEQLVQVMTQLQQDQKRISTEINSIRDGMHDLQNLMVSLNAKRDQQLEQLKSMIMAKDNGTIVPETPMHAQPPPPSQQQQQQQQQHRHPDASMLLQPSPLAARPAHTPRRSLNIPSTVQPFGSSPEVLFKMLSQLTQEQRSEAMRRLAFAGSTPAPIHPTHA